MSKLHLTADDKQSSPHCVSFNSKFASFLGASTHSLLLGLAIHYVSHDAFGQPLEEMSQLVQVVCGVHEQVKMEEVKSVERNK